MLHSGEPRPRVTLEPLLLDLRHALRALLRDRAFTLTAIGTLTLAMALNVAGFTLMQAMLFRGYPLVEQNDRLVYIQERGALGCCVAYGNFDDWRRDTTSFEGMAFVDGRQLTLRDENGGRERLSAPTVSADLFRLLGVQPALGRDFAADDEAPGAAPVAILSHGFWQGRFRGSADVIGQTLVTEDATLTVIGVMPEGFSFPEQHELWTPLPSTLAATDRSPSGFLVVARLVDGATVAGAQAELTTSSRRLASAYPDTNRGVEPEVRSHAEFFFGEDAKVLYGSLWAATWFVLLIACANVANLCVVRTMGRGHDLSTRLALGAGHWRMGRQILIENVSIAITAGVCAWWLAGWSIATYAATTASVHYVLDFSMGLGLLAYAAAIALGACALFTFVPIANLWRIDVSAQLKGGARGFTPALSRKQAVLIIGQMIFAMVLLSGAGYFSALGAAILTGRDFATADQASSPPVAIVNQRFAEAHWPNGEAVGQRVRLRRSGDADGTGEWLTVVGIASNIMQTDATRQSYAPLVYLPQRQSPAPYFWMLAKTTVSPNAVAAAARRELQSLDPDLYLSNVAPLEEIIAFNAEFMDVAHQHLGRNAVLFPIFAVSALLLAAVGLYAVIAHSVGRRTREIGVRMAVGATAGQIWRWVLRQGMGPVAVGLVVGLAVSLGVNRVLRSQLIGVEFYDPVTMVVAPAVLVIVGLLACRVPARRAMKVDPVVALRRE